MSAHDRYLEGVRHAERVCAESDLYWRTNRWEWDLPREIYIRATNMPGSFQEARDWALDEMRRCSVTVPQVLEASLDLIAELRHNDIRSRQVGDSCKVRPAE